MKQCVNPLPRFSLLTFVPHSKVTTWEIFCFNASNATSTCLMSSALAVVLNLKQTTCWSLSAALALTNMPDTRIADRITANVFMWTEAIAIRAGCLGRQILADGVGAGQPMAEVRATAVQQAAQPMTHESHEPDVAAFAQQPTEPDRKS